MRLAFVPARPDCVWKTPPCNNYIDEHIFAKLRTLRMNPSELCSDEVFVRRAYLDLLGILPTAEEARAFVNRSAASSRRKEAHYSKSEIGNRKSEIGNPKSETGKRAR